VKKPPEWSISIGFNIFITTLGIVFVALLLTGLVFLLFFSATLNGLVERNAREINKQIVMNFESYINSVIETANYIEFASYNRDLTTEAAALSELLRQNVNLKRDVLAIFLFDSTGNKVLGSGLDVARRDSVASQAWFRTTVATDGVFHFNDWQASSLVDSREDLVIPVSKSFEFLNGGRLERGVLLIELNNAGLTDLARKTNLGRDGFLLIVDEAGSLLYSSEASPDRRTAPALAVVADLFMGGQRHDLAGTEMFVNVNTLGQTRWRIVTISNADESAGLARRLIVLLLFILAVITLLAALFSGLISMRLSKPISQLKSSMLEIETGKFIAPIEVRGQREIVSLAHSFNSMIGKLQDLMARLVDEQQEKRKTELRALQNQINPHFLYNTLDSIVWLAEQQRNKDVIATVVALARFFRISISKGQNFISLAEEMEHVRHYLTIQSIRYVNKFTYGFDVPDELLAGKVMKLVLQPLVENAIYHGVGGEGGHIAIAARQRDGFLVLSVTNTGYGISDEKIALLCKAMRGTAEKSSVGLRNVYQRLKLYYGESADILVESRPDESTTISLLVPLAGPEERS